MPEPNDNTPPTIPEQPEAKPPLRKTMPVVVALVVIMGLIGIANLSSLLRGSKKAAPTGSVPVARPAAPNAQEVNSFETQQQLQAERDAQERQHQQEVTAAMQQLEAAEGIPGPEGAAAPPMTAAQRAAIYGESPNAPVFTSDASQEHAEAAQRELAKEKQHQEAIASDTVAIDFEHPSAAAAPSPVTVSPETKPETASAQPASAQQAKSAEGSDLVNFLLRLVVCCLLENYWVNPFPGASFGINHFFSYIAQAMVAAFDQNSLNQLLQLLKTAGDNTAMPSLMAPVQILCYFVVQGLLGIASAILFVINCSAFILYGVTALFGPVFIPLLMTHTFRAKFFHFLDVLVSFAMIRAVAAAFIFVWAGFMNAFLQQTFNGNYSIEMWLANLIPCIMVFVAFIVNMLFIPSMAQAIFGGAAGLVSAAPSAVGGGAVLLAKSGGG